VTRSFSNLRTASINCLREPIGCERALCGIDRPQCSIPFTSTNVTLGLDGKQRDR
jgi:hypothetical protein